MVEVPRGLRWEGELRPLTLWNENTALLLCAAGTSSTNIAGTFYGPAGVGRRGGAGYLTANFTGLSATGVVVEVFLQGAPAGSVVVAGSGTLGTLSATNPVIVRCSASARDGGAGAWFSFKLSETTMFTATNGATLTGDEFRLAPAAPAEVVGTLKHVVVQGAGLDRLTLVNESAQFAPVPPLALEIRRVGAGVAVSWPVASCYYLQTKVDLPGPWQSIGGSQYADFRQHVTLPELTNTTRFFQLRHGYGHHIHPGPP